ncbi:helix-turn-helix domain-containing protein [Gorillibacterium sp. sgz5001074]|uniref:helix-turn-helix domain-containing protein n=1 Tax=Gorillibacterium sp. sgz5001074 TaxID=3446695 RepID=UPI003F675BA3
MRETLTAKEAAAIIGICEDTLYEMVRQKQIPHFRVRRRILFRHQTLLKWMESLESASMDVSA